MSEPFYSEETPVGPILFTRCLYPESTGERPDIPTGLVCLAHNRSIYLCLDNSVLWCDGYEGGDDYVPHELEVS